MNTVELLDNCHLKIIQVLDDLPELQWDIPEVCGDWSVKEIVAHLTSYELALAEALNTLSGQEPPHISPGSSKMGQNLTMKRLKNAGTGLPNTCWMNIMTFKYRPCHSYSNFQPRNYSKKAQCPGMVPNVH